MANDILYQSDHRGDGLAKLLQQFHGMPRFAVLAAALLDQIQKLEDVLWKLYLDWIDTATSARLDTIGRLVGETRQGIPDDEYRAFIRARIRANRSTGLLMELVQIAALIQGDAFPVRSVEYYPAAIEIQPTSPVVVDPYRVGKMLKSAKPGGVSLHFAYLTTDDSLTFELDDAGGTSVVTGAQSFGDGSYEPALGGGLFAGVYG